MKKDAPLTEADKEKLNSTLIKFHKESRKRWFGLIAFFAIGALIVVFAGWENTDFMINSFIMLGIFAILVVIVFKIIIIFLTKKFTLDLNSNTKTVYEGKITGKNVNVIHSEMTHCEVDKDAKLIKATTVQQNEGKTTYHRWSYDKDDSTGYLRLNTKLELIIDDDPVMVDLKHFALFDEGEKVRAEQFTKSKQLIRVSSLDDPNKIVETKTIKFK